MSSSQALPNTPPGGFYFDLGFKLVYHLGMLTLVSWQFYRAWALNHFHNPKLKEAHYSRIFAIISISTGVVTSIDSNSVLGIYPPYFLIWARLLYSLCGWVSAILSIVSYMNALKSIDMFVQKDVKHVHAKNRIIIIF
jgi:hypothetical protein